MGDLIVVLGVLIGLALAVAGAVGLLSASARRRLPGGEGRAVSVVALVLGLILVALSLGVFSD